MRKPFRLSPIVLIALFVLSLGALAQAPPSGAAIAGIVTNVSSDSLTIEGLTLGVTENTKFFTVLPDGIIAATTFDQIVPGESLHGRFIFVNGVATLVVGEQGNDFFWHGKITAADDTTLTLDNFVTIYISQAKVVGTGSLQIGDTVGVRGEVFNGIFAAKWINSSGIDFNFKGTIGSLIIDGGHVTGFTVGDGSGSYLVTLDPHSLIWKGRRQLSPDALQVGMKVKVAGWTLPDGSVLAWSVKIRGN